MASRNFEVVSRLKACMNFELGEPGRDLFPEKS